MSNLGLGGLMSGINTDDILYKLMQIENTRIDLEKAKKADLAAKQDAWNKVKASLETLRTKLDGVRFSASFRSRSATLSDETVASATASSGATLTTHSLSVTQLAQAEVMRSTAGFAAGDTLDFGLGASKIITYSSTDTLYTLRDRINALDGVPTKAEVVTVTSGGVATTQLVLTAKQTGSAGFSVVGTGAAKLATTTTPQNALFTLDGQSYDTESNLISDAISGLSITLRKSDPAGAATDITVGQDTSGAANAVKAWVDALNSSISTLRSLTKYELGTKQKGILNGDGLARNILNSLTSALSAEVPGLPSGYRNLSDVGVTTGAWGTEDFGKVLVDASKLSAKLTTDEDAVARIFGALRLESNLALGGVATGSTETSPAANAIDSDTASYWESAAVNGTAQTLDLDLGSAKSFDMIKLANPDGIESPTAGLKDYKIKYQDPSTLAWKELQAVTDSLGTSRAFSFDPIVARYLTLEVTATYGNSAAKVSDLQVLETNRGVATQMYRFVNGSLTFKTGTLDVRNDTYGDQIKVLDDKINKMYLKMADNQARLKAQFDRMEQSLSKLQAQGNQIGAMMGMYTNQK